jgi:hypothetical protein
MPILIGMRGHTDATEFSFCLKKGTIFSDNFSPLRRGTGWREAPGKVHSLARLKMNPEADSIRRGMGTPRAAAIAGILLSLLLMGSMLLIRTSIPADPLAEAADIINHSKRITLALNILMTTSERRLGLGPPR